MPALVATLFVVPVCPYLKSQGQRSLRSSSLSSACVSRRESR